MKILLFNWIKSLYLLGNDEPLEVLLANEGFQNDKYYWMLGLLGAMIIASIFIWWLTRQVLVGIIHTFASRTKTQLDDILVEKKFFNAIAHILPLMFMDYFFSIVFFAFPDALDFSKRINDVLIIFAVLVSVRRFLNALQVILQEKPFFHGKPIGAYNQTIKLIVTLVFIIILLTVITGKSPTFFLTSLGAMTAVLLLVFKDTILGFVGSIQITANDMLRIGDWVTMEKYGADGDVIEINLTTVKVQNFDKTITTIPTYSFIADSFKNWRGMTDSDGRRIKRSLNIKVEKIKFAEKELIERLSKVKLLSKFIEEQQQDIKDYNEKNGLNTPDQLNARRQTNIGLFRRYIEYYLQKNPLINQDMTLMVRQLQTTTEGLPIEIYCFSATQVWAEYEVVMADIFDHLLSVVHAFDLDIHQSPTGSDFHKLVE
jgi:miniconductance mechanosensitive channel